MSTSPVFSPVVTQKASTAIYEQVRGMILNGDLKPGDKLPSERELIKMMHRSRPVIREGLRMLENAGLVRIVPGGGAIVSEPSINSVQEPLESILALQSVSDRELFEYRSYISEAIAAWAAQHRTEEDLEALLRCIRQSEDSVDDFDRFLQLDVHFRVLIAQASHNRLAVILENVVHNIVVEMITATFATKTEEERREINNNIIADDYRIYQAIKNRDSERARQEIQRQSRLFWEDLGPRIHEN